METTILTVQEVLEQTNLNWRVRTEEVQTASGIIIPNKKAIIRDDNNLVLGVHGDGYQPYQNEEMCEVLFQISKSTGLQVHTGGSLDNSSKVFVQLKSDDLRIGNDKVEGYLTGVNSFDGSTSFGFGNSTLTISCQNTFFRAMKQVQSKVRHTMNMHYKIDDILRRIDGLVESEKETFEEIKRMADVRMTETMEKLVVDVLFNISEADRLANNISTRKQNQIELFKNSLAIELATKNDSVWGLMSGVTRYTTHEAFKTAEKSMSAKLFGATGETERTIYNKLVQMVY